MSASPRVVRTPFRAPDCPPLARVPVIAALIAQVVVLSVFSDGYGYHRDELYFRMLHPGWGYLDQPPLTPLLVRATTVLADQPWALRIPATIFAAVSVMIIALITREVGGDRRAQALAAWAFAFGSFPLVLGHVFLTTSLDGPIWLLVLLFIIRARLREEPRWWYLAGIVVGLGFYNKLLIVVMLAAVAAGLLVIGPRRVLVSRAVLGAGALAVLIGLPNVIYQATHGWPQLEFGRQLAAHNSGSVRVAMWPFLALLLGPPLVVAWVAGLVTLWRREGWRPVRFLVPAFAMLLVLTFVLGSQPYYPYAFVGALFAIGCVPVTEWLSRRPRGWTGLALILVAVNVVVSLLIDLPIVPEHSLGATPIPGINQLTRDAVGWPAYVDQVTSAYRALPPADRARAVLVASNYGEAGALDRYGPARGLPPVFSAQNQLYFQGRPPGSASVVVFVGGQIRAGGAARDLFTSCADVGTLDNGVGVDNEEQGQPIAVCRDPVGGWARIWPLLKHED